MDELIDLVNKNGNPIGKQILKSEAHKRGLLHASVHVWIFFKNKNILLQQRKNTKETFPNLWDVSVAGHISAGETHIQAAHREVLEEIGISILPKYLQYHGIWEEKHQHPTIIDHEIHHIYTYLCTDNHPNFRIQTSEVSAIAQISWIDLDKKIQDTKDMVPHDGTYYQHIQNLLIKRFLTL